MTHRIFSDQTGKLPTRGRSGGKYLMIVYVYDTNTILVKSLKSKKETDLNKAYDEIYEELEKRNHTPIFHRVDNELSNENKNWLRTKGVTPEIVPLQCHRRNLAERAIRSYKNHLIAGISSTHPSFPDYLWEDLILQSIITINLLRASRIHPHLSSYHSFFGKYDFTKTPIAPPGIKVIA